MKVKILRSATNDLVEGYRFYEQCAPGVGAYFLDSLYSDIDSLVITAGMHPKVFGDYHRMLSKRFPFADGPRSGPYGNTVTRRVRCADRRPCRSRDGRIYDQGATGHVLNLDGGLAG